MCAGAGTPFVGSPWGLGRLIHSRGLLISRKLYSTPISTVTVLVELSDLLNLAAMSSIAKLPTITDDELVLPPDVSADSFRRALNDIADIVGAENVDVHTINSMKHDDEGHYFNLPKEHDLFYVLEKDVFLASAVARPGSVEEVSQIVKLANKHLVPLWPTSMGRNLGAKPLELAMDLVLLIQSIRLWWCCSETTGQCRP